MSDVRCEIVNEKLLAGCARRSSGLSLDNAAAVTGQPTDRHRTQAGVIQPFPRLTARLPEASTPRRPQPTRPPGLVARRLGVPRGPVPRRATTRDPPPGPAAASCCYQQEAATGRLTFTHSAALYAFPAGRPPASDLSLYPRRHLVPQVTRIGADTTPKVVTAGTRPTGVAGVAGGSADDTFLLAVIRLGGGDLVCLRSPCMRGDQNRGRNGPENGHGAYNVNKSDWCY
jgi:hypothetical protein